MTLDQLRIFIEVARHEHVTRAAHMLNMTQSAVSAAIAALEARHAVRLFDRVGRRIELTTAGRAFVAEAEAVMRRADAAERFLADLSGKVSGVLRLHASQTVASYWLPPFLMRYHALYPDVALQLTPGNTTTVARQVREGEADLGVVEGGVAGPGLLVERVAQDRLVVIVGRGHPWADGRALAPADLATASWVMREEGSGTRAAFEAQLSYMGVAPGALPVALELPSNEACLAAVAGGGGATVLSRRAAAPHLSHGKLVEAGLSLPLRDFSVLRHGERHPARAVAAMIALLRSAEPRQAT